MNPGYLYDSMDEFHNHNVERNEMKEVRYNRIYKNKQNIFIYVEFKNKQSQVPMVLIVRVGDCQERG